MERIKDTINHVIKTLSEKMESVPGTDPGAALKKILTRSETRHIKFNYFKKGTAYFNVDTSGWMYSFNLKKEAMLSGLKKEVPEIADIRFRIGDVNSGQRDR